MDTEYESIDHKAITWENRGWFVAEISNRRTNPIHSCLVFYAGEGYNFNLRVNETYEDNELKVFKNVTDFYYLKLVRRVDMSIEVQKDYE